MMETYSFVRGDYSATMPEDIYLAINRALARSDFRSNVNSRQSVAPERFYRAIMAADAPGAMLNLQIDIPRDCLSHGDFILGYGRSTLDDEAVFTAYHKALKCNRLKNNLKNAIWVGVIVSAPKSAFKLSRSKKIREEIHQNTPKTSMNEVSFIHQGCIQNTVEVYILLLRERWHKKMKESIKDFFEKVLAKRRG